MTDRRLPAIVHNMLGPLPRITDVEEYGRRVQELEDTVQTDHVFVDDLGRVTKVPPLEEEDPPMPPRPEELDLLPTCNGQCACHGESAYIGNPARSGMKVPAPDPGLPDSDDDEA